MGERQWPGAVIGTEETMSTTAIPPVAVEVDQWLSRFDEALTKRYCSLFRGSGRLRNDDGEGRHDLRVAYLPDHGRVAGSGVGASELMAEGNIKLQPGQVDHLTEDAVVMADGTELPADLVVYATGYESMTGFVSDLITPEVATRWARSGV
jgi:cation diffusion facilitator CzcD-associated flavoprotein CzcO